ncbi:MAG: hypothetical protein RML36_15350 [Anaerolineae bacterium]|nr:hypothetical protein [Anaerolineae bacterium]
MSVSNYIQPSSAVLRLSQTFPYSSNVHVSNTVNQANNRDYEISVTVRVMAAVGQIPAYIQILYKNEQGDFDEPDPAAAFEFVTLRTGQITILDTYRVSPRDFKLAIGAMMLERSVPPLQLEIWGNKIEIAPA